MYETVRNAIVWTPMVVQLNRATNRPDRQNRVLAVAAAVCTWCNPIIRRIGTERHTTNTASRGQDFRPTRADSGRSCESIASCGEIHRGLRIQFKVRAGAEASPNGTSLLVTGNSTRKTDQPLRPDERFCRRAHPTSLICGACRLPSLKQSQIDQFRHRSVAGIVRM